MEKTIEVECELFDETLMKLDKLAAELGKTRDDLINESLQALLYDSVEPAGA